MPKLERWASCPNHPY